MEIHEYVKDWAEVFGVNISDEARQPEVARKKLSYKLLEEEVREVKEEVFTDEGDIKTNVDLYSIAKELGDTLWVTLMAMYEYGLDPKRIIQGIYQSNMSKACNNEKEVDDAQYHYDQLGVDTKAIKSKGKYIILRASDDKILKSLNYQVADLGFIQ